MSSSLLPMDPKPGMELNLFSFLRSLVAMVGVVVVSGPKVCACVGNVGEGPTLSVAKELLSVDEPVVLGVW